MLEKSPKESDEIDAYAAERLEAIDSNYPVDRLKEEFGLRRKEAEFVRAFCATMNCRQSAKIAGYGKSSVDNHSYQLPKKENVSKAIDAVMFEVVNPLTQRKIISITNTTMARLCSIVKNGTNDEATRAAKSLLDYMNSEMIRIPEAADDHDDIPNEEIEASLKRMGVTDGN